MLYDQAMLLIAYSEAYQATGSEEYKKTSQEILDYAIRVMKSPEGAFYSAEDADSEGEEGKFYLWTMGETRETLPREAVDIVIKAFNVEEDGNFIDGLTGKKNGKNIFHMRKTVPELASELGFSAGKLQRILDEARVEMFTARQGRVRPYKDDKILLSWNGLMIASLAKAAGAFDEKKYVDHAVGALDFILQKMRSDGRLFRRYRDGEARVPAFLEDYSHLVWGLLEIYEATFNPGFLNLAVELNGDLIKRFWNEENGGFYFSADDTERVLIRSKEIYDGALPSGNSVAMLNLLRLSRITGSPELEEKV